MIFFIRGVDKDVLCDTISLDMRNLYFDTKALDEAACQKYGMSHLMLMENAGRALLEAVVRKASLQAVAKPRVLVACGAGDNGGDGYVLLRLLTARGYDCVAWQYEKPKSSLCKLQENIVRKLGVRFIEKEAASLESFDIVVECLVGSSLHGAPCAKLTQAICFLNGIDGVKIACDVPCGLPLDEEQIEVCFRADFTVCMGALKYCLFTDSSVDYAGVVEVGNLGLQDTLFENGSEAVSPCAVLLEENDDEPPYRTRRNCNKGSFGHAVFVLGEKQGAAMLAAKAAMCFGAGLTTLVGDFATCHYAISPSIMTASYFPENATAIAVGMGLGRDNERLRDQTVGYLLAHSDLPCVLDADLLYDTDLQDIVSSLEYCILTPHPKEFAAMFSNAFSTELTVQNLQAHRLQYAKKWAQRFGKRCTLLLKGAASIIVQGDNVFLNTTGTNALAKGGSGDVLSGMICSLLAQGYSTVQAAITASLCHSKASRKARSNYSFCPDELIDNLASL